MGKIEQITSRLNFWSLFKVFAQMKEHAKLKKAATLIELPKGCEYWNDDRLRRQIKDGVSHDFDSCRHGLKQPSGNFGELCLGISQSVVARMNMDHVLVGKLG